MLKFVVRFVACFALLQLAGCDAASSSSASDASSSPEATEGNPSDGLDAGADMPQIPLLHHPSDTPCTQPRPASNRSSCDRFTQPDSGECGSDLDCTAGPNGRCDCNASSPLPANNPQCSYDVCASDNNCKRGEVCDCRESPAHVTWGTQTVCVAANCRTDSDCGPAGYCSPSPLAGCGADSWYGYFCHTPGDQCVNDADCHQGNAYCAYDMSSSRWVCATGICIDG